MKKMLFVILFIMASSGAYAGCSADQCDGVGTDVLQSIYPNGSRVYLQAGSNRNALDCDLVEGHYMVLLPEHPMFEEIYSTILTAMVSQKRLKIRIKNDSPICEVAYVRMYF